MNLVCCFETLRPHPPKPELGVPSGLAFDCCFDENDIAWWVWFTVPLLGYCVSFRVWFTQWKHGGRMMREKNLQREVRIFDKVLVSL